MFLKMQILMALIDSRRLLPLCFRLAAKKVSPTAITRDLLLHRLLSVLHQHPDGSGRRVELGHMVLVYDLPHPADVRVGGQTLELKKRRLRGWKGRSRDLACA